jgi:diaminopimelate epimerase
VKYVEGLADLDVFTRGKEIKTNKKCFPEGCNVNFVEDMGEALLAVRTYERGVEAETLSCGTGSIAAAIVQHHCGTVFDKYHIKAKGGNLAVTFTYDEQRGYENVCLEGPAELVFKGEYQL